MKNLIVILAIFLVSSQAFGQKKSKEDPKDVQIAALTKQLDSISKELVKYTGVYDTLVKKVVRYKFDPARTSFLIDSLKMKPMDSTYIRLASARADTIYVLKKENLAMKASIALSSSEEAKAKFLMTQDEIDKAKVVAILKQYKELVHAKVLTEAEFVTLKKKYIDSL